MSQTLEEKRKRRKIRRARRKAYLNPRVKQSSGTYTSDDPQQLELPTAPVKLKTVKSLVYPKDTQEPRPALTRLMKLAEKFPDIGIVLQLLKWHRRESRSPVLSEEYRVARGMHRFYAKQLWVLDVTQGWKRGEPAMSPFAQTFKKDDAEIAWARKRWTADQAKKKVNRLNRSRR